MPVLTTCCFKNKFPFIMVFRHLHTDNVQINFHSASSKRPCKPQVFWIKTIFNTPNCILYNCSVFGFNYSPLFLFSFTVHTNRSMGSLNKNSLHLSHECEFRLECPRHFLCVHISGLLLQISASIMQGLQLRGTWISGCPCDTGDQFCNECDIIQRQIKRTDYKAFSLVSTWENFSTTSCGQILPLLTIERKILLYSVYQFLQFVSQGVKYSLYK